MANDDEHSDSWIIFAHLHNKIIPIQCGYGTQQVAWIGHIAIARYYETDGMSYSHRQGWVDFGIPSKILKNGIELQLRDVICEVLENRAHVYITTTLQNSSGLEM